MSVLYDNIDVSQEHLEVAVADCAGICSGSRCVLRTSVLDLRSFDPTLGFSGDSRPAGRSPALSRRAAHITSE